MFQMQKLVGLVRYGEEQESQPAPEFDIKALLEHPSVKEYAERLAAERTDGLRKKNEQLLGENKGLKGDLRSYHAGIEDEEDLKALKSGQADFKTLADKRVQAANQEWQQRHDALLAEREADKKAAAEIQAQLKRFNIENQIADAAAKNKFVNPGAVKEIKRKGVEIFDIDENGQVVARDSNGNIRLDKHGKPLTPGTWLDILPEEYDFYFLPQAGSGSRPGGGSGKVYSRRAFADAVAAAPTEEARKALLAQRDKGEVTIHG